MSIITAIENNVLKIKMNRPDVLNSFNREMALEMQSALDDANADENIRCILIKGEGRAFCAGQDLEEAISDNDLDIKTIVNEHYNPIIKKIREIEKPVIAMVNGVAAGAGANIALACDIVFASNKASFIQAFSQIGLIPDSGGTYFLPRLIGMAKATALMFTAEKLSAEEAEQIGLIYKCIPTEYLESKTLAFAEKIAKMPTKGLGLTKRCLNSSMDNTLDEQLKFEEEMQAIAGSTHDYKEGVNAFLQKRNPNFLGK